MKIIKIFPSIIKDEDFKITNAEQCKPPLQCRQGHSFRLMGDTTDRKYGFEVFFDNYFTNVDTDFILDVPTSCLIFFETTDTAVPTVDNLYALYLQANNASGWAIVQEANKHNLKADFLPLNSPLSIIEDSLKQVIANLFKEE